MNTILHYGFAPDAPSTFEVPLAAKLLSICEVDAGLQAHFIVDESNPRANVLGVVSIYVALVREPIPEIITELYTYAGPIVMARTALASAELERKTFRPYLERTVLHVFVLGPEAKDAEGLEVSRRAHAPISRYGSRRR